MNHGNLIDGLPAPGGPEQVHTLFERRGTRIERIVSLGQASPPGFWYEQAEDEWVCLLAGAAGLEFEHGRIDTLRPGDWRLIPAGLRHRVAWTDVEAVWLAVFVAGG